MKTVQDKDGNIVEVADDTPCHAGINGALPIMLDAIKDAGIFTEMAAKEVDYAEEAPQRAQDIIKAEIQHLESKITPRRLREAILGTDNGWLANQDSLISTERNKL